MTENKTFTVELTESELINLIQATMDYKGDEEAKAINLKLIEALVSQK